MANKKTAAPHRGRLPNDPLDWLSGIEEKSPQDAASAPASKPEPVAAASMGTKTQENEAPGEPAQPKAAFITSELKQENTMSETNKTENKTESGQPGRCEAINEIRRLAEAAKNGQWDARADAAGMKGESAGAVAAVNEIMECFKLQQLHNRDTLLGSVSTNVQLADKDNNITYMNPALIEMFSIAESDIRKQLPQFDSKKLIGMNMDAFHKVPSHQRNLVGGLKGKINTQITVGGRIFSLIATPLFGINGEREGTAVEWADITVSQNITSCLEAAAQGDLTQSLVPAELCRGENLALRNSAALLRNSIGALLADAGMLSQAAVDGKLATRADASKHQGDYRKIVEGVNNTLDAVIGPLNIAADYVDRISQGAIPAKITDNYNGDFNAIKNNLNQCIDAINGIVADATSLSQAIVDGQLNVRADASRHQGDYAKIIVAFENALVGLNNTFYQITDTVEQVGQSAEQLNAASQSMASSSEQQSSSVEEVTSSLAQTDSQVKANTDNANAANQLVIGTSQAAQLGQQKMEGMVDAMAAINQSSQNIAKIIKVIDEIAFQTNLLALNAAVEAARAGQHGRGFAVVAQEVRNLAGRSAKAARETAEMIEDSTKRVVEGVGITNETRDALGQIVGNVVKMKDLVAEIASASAEQSIGVSQINVAMNQVAQAALEGSQQAEELASSSTELTHAADQMRTEIRRFKLRERQQHTDVSGLEGLTPELLRQLKALLAAQQTAFGAPAPKAAAPARAKSPKAILPLDADERGFDGF